MKHTLLLISAVALFAASCSKGVKTVPLEGTTWEIEPNHNQKIFFNGGSATITFPLTDPVTMQYQRIGGDTLYFPVSGNKAIVKVVRDTLHYIQLPSLTADIYTSRK